MCGVKRKRKRQNHRCLLNTGVQILSGLLATAAIAALSEAVPVGGVAFLVVVVALAIAAFTRGERLPLTVKVLVTASIYYLGYSVCLGGRTMEPRLNAHAVSMALLSFVLFAAAPTISIVRLWRPRVALILMAAILPVSLLTAATVAAVEEHLFIQKYRDTSVGPTPRWTVSNHWLSYDHKTQRLEGSD